MAKSRDRRKLRRELQEAGLGHLLTPPPPPSRPPRIDADEPGSPKRRFWARIPVWVWLLFVFLATAITLLEGYPWLSIERDDSLNALDPYETMFSVANEGYVTLTDLDALCFPDFGNKEYTLGVRDSEFTYPHFAKSLFHSSRVTLPCFKPIRMRRSPDELNASSLINLTIVVNYAFMGINLAFLRRSQTFEFSAERAADGSLHWKYIRRPRGISVSEPRR